MRKTKSKRNMKKNNIFFHINQKSKMTSAKSKISSFYEMKRNSSLSTTKSVQTNSYSKSLSIGPIAGSKASKMFSSFPFRYAFASDGCTQKDSVSPKRNSSPHSNSNLLTDSQEFSSSSLSGRYYSTGSGPEPEPEEEILLKKNDFDQGDSNGRSFDISSPSKQGMFFVAEDDDNEKQTSTEYAEEDDIFVDEFTLNDTNFSNLKKNKLLECVQSESSFSNLYKTTTLPNKISDDVSSLKKYGIKRHHSAPQPVETKWLQVRLCVLK